jgi:hypothetical protein
MVSLKIKTGTRHEVEKGYVTVQGNCIALYEVTSKGVGRLVFAYCLNPGEVLTSKGDDYIVEY